MKPQHRLISTPVSVAHVPPKGKHTKRGTTSSILLNPLYSPSKKAPPQIGRQRPNLAPPLPQSPPSSAMMSAPLAGVAAWKISVNLFNFDLQFKDFLQRFSLYDPVTGVRQTGVARAWRMEQAEVIMGGKGTGCWTREQVKELIETGRVRGAEGHHINSVSEHPELQADPNNIKFVSSRDAHLNEHSGNFQNETTGDLIDRQSRLANAQKHRIIKNEILGLGIVTAVGFATGFTISFVSTLAQTGINPGCIKNALISGAKAGGESALFSLGGYVAGRIISPLITGIISKVGGNIAQSTMANIVGLCNMAVVGTLTIVAVSVVQFKRLKQMGFSTQESLLRTGKNAALSFSLLLLSVAVTAYFGPHAGVAVSVVSVTVIAGYTVIKAIKDIKNRKLSENLSLYVIELSQPKFA